MNNSSINTFIIDNNNQHDQSTTSTLSSSSSFENRSLLLLEKQKKNNIENNNSDNYNNKSLDLSSPIFSMSPSLLMFSTSQNNNGDDDNNNINYNKKYSFSSNTSSISDSGTESIVDDDFSNDISQTSAIQLMKKMNGNLCHSTPMKNVNNIDDIYDNDDDSDNDSESTLSNCQSPPSSYLSSPIENNVDEFGNDCTPKSNDTIFNLNNVYDILNKKLFKDNEKQLDNSNNNQNDNTLSNVTLKNIDKIVLNYQHDNDSDNSSDDHIENDQSIRNDRRNSTLVRSTSLKTGKTPPGSPGGGKKFVRFADALGLDLTSIRHIVDDDYLPPLSAFKSLQLDDDDRNWLLNNRYNDQQQKQQLSSFNNMNTTANEIQATMKMLFEQPINDPIKFMERVRNNKICLENCLLDGPIGNNNTFKINCIVRVLNICYQKKIILRYTTNEWLTWIEIPGNYIQNSNDGFSDKFQINFDLAVNSNGHQTMMPGQRLMFAIRFIDDNFNEYWDNNFGINYSFIYQRN